MCCAANVMDECQDASVPPGTRPRPCRCGQWRPSGAIGRLFLVDTFGSGPLRASARISSTEPAASSGTLSSPATATETLGQFRQFLAVEFSVLVGVKSERVLDELTGAWRTSSKTAARSTRWAESARSFSRRTRTFAFRVDKFRPSCRNPLFCRAVPGSCPLPPYLQVLGNENDVIGVPVQCQEYLDGQFLVRE